MISDATIAEWVLRLYDETQWHKFVRGVKPEKDDGICWGHACVDESGTYGLRGPADYDLLIFRGSVTAQDWFRDFVCLPHTLREWPGIGPVHAGFADGMEDAAAAINRTVWPGAPFRPIIAGHSLGAARAWIYAASRIALGMPVARIVCFGSPRPGYAQLAGLIGEVPARSYRNGPDPVCAVPFALPDIPYVEPVAFTPICEPPAPDDKWPGSFAWHHMELYSRGMTPIRVLEE